MPHHKYEYTSENEKKFFVIALIVYETRHSLVIFTNSVRKNNARDANNQKNN